MNELIIHIGFPKTGTSSLQSILGQYTWYLGKNIGLDSQKTDVRRLFRSFFGLTQIRTDVMQFLESIIAESGDSSTGLYSDEDLSLCATVKQGGGCFISWPFSRRTFEYPCQLSSVPFIENMIRLIPALLHENINLKIIVTTRRQWGLIPSLYYQRSDRNIFASQADFDSQVAQILNRPEYFNFNLWYDVLVNHLTADNILFLPLEMIDKAEYWERLEQFIGMSLCDKKKVEALNVAQRSGFKENEYHIKNLSYKTFETAGKKIVCHPLSTSAQALSYLTTKTGEKNNFKFNLRKGKARSFSISMPQKKDLIAQYKLENASLAKKIHIDLPSIGY